MQKPINPADVWRPQIRQSGQRNGGVIGRVAQSVSSSAGGKVASIGMIPQPEKN